MQSVTGLQFIGFVFWHVACNATFKPVVFQDSQSVRQTVSGDSIIGRSVVVSSSAPGIYANMKSELSRLPGENTNVSSPGPLLSTSNSSPSAINVR